MTCPDLYCDESLEEEEEEFVIYDLFIINNTEQEIQDMIDWYSEEYDLIFIPIP